MSRQSNRCPLDSKSGGRCVYIHGHAGPCHTAPEAASKGRAGFIAPAAIPAPNAPSPVMQKFIIATPKTTAATTDAIRAAVPERDPNHADDELIEEVKLPDWLAIGVSTNRPQLLGVGMPEHPDQTDLWFAVNLCRVLMETNASLRKRLAGLKEETTTARKRERESANRLRRVANVLDSRRSRGEV